MPLAFLPILKTVWKPVAIILVIVAAWFLFDRWLDGVRDTAYKAGESASESRHRAELDRVNLSNREREKALSDDLRAFSDRFATLTSARHQREQEIVSRVEQRIVEQPNCEIDPEIIRFRNEVRAQ